MRYYAMQASMWLVFAAALASAAVTTHLHASWRFPLGQAIVLQTMSVRLPEKWKLLEDSDSVRALEPLRSPLARAIQVIESDPNAVGFFSWLNPSRASRTDRRRAANQETIKIGPVTGTLTLQVQQPRGTLLDELDEEAMAFDERVQAVSLIAAGTLPSGHDVIITLDSVRFDDEVDPQDLALLKQVAASVKLLDDGPQLRRK
jgi:hypothetical protein